MKFDCPYCNAEMSREDISMTFSNQIENSITFCCPKCHKESIRTFYAASGGTGCVEQSYTLPTFNFCGSTKLIHCKDCTHLEYEDLGIYYCGLHYITGQLNPEDYCSRGKRREKQRNAATD